MVKNKSVAVVPEKQMNPAELKRRKRMAVLKPEGFLEFARDFGERYKKLYPRNHSIPKIVECAAIEWGEMSLEDKAPFLQITKVVKEYEQASLDYWKANSNLQNDDVSDSDPF